jgi:hypothetical protein
MFLGLALAYPRASASAAGAVVVLLGWGIWSATHPSPPVPKPGPAPTPIAVVTPAPAIKSEATPAPAPIIAVASPTPAPVPSTPVAKGPGTPAPWMNIVNGGTPPPGPWNGNPPPAATPPAMPPAPAGLDRKVIGTWSAKVQSASGFVVLHWEQKEDGSYVSTSAGVKIDSGVITAQNGNIHRVSATPNVPPADVTYWFDESHLVTYDPTYNLAPVSWTRIGKASTSSRSRSRSSDDDEPATHHSVPHSAPDWQSIIRHRFGF